MDLTIIKLCSYFRSYNYITNVFRIDSGSESSKSFNSLVRAFDGDSVGMLNGMSFWIRGQQDGPLYMLTVSSDVSIQVRHWKPLSVHL